MKKTLLIMAVIAGLQLMAQSPTPRLSLFEEFTGENCPPCAATNPALNALLAQPTNTAKVVAIKWQVPIPSAPSNTWSLYQTNKAEIDWRYKSTAAGGYGYMSQWTSTTAPTSGINAAPTGFFDGQHQWVFGASSDHPINVTNAVISAAQSQTAAFSVSMARAWDATYSSVNLTVNIVATANFSSVPTPSTNPTGTLVFRTVMVEKYIHFNTPPGTNGEKDFEDVAIRSFPTLSTGIAMAIPESYEGQVRPRSGLAAKYGVTVTNSPGLIDAGYRGEYNTHLVNLSGEPYTVNEGDKVSQIIIYPVVIAELEETELIDAVLAMYEKYRDYEEQGYKPFSSWFESMSKKFKFDRRKIAQELECDFLGSGDGVIPGDLQDRKSVV